MKLENTTAIITGSTGGLGRNIALALAEGGCDCVCHYNTNREAAEELVAEINKTNSKAIAVGADLRVGDQVGKLFEIPVSFAPVRILINSAGVFSRGPLEEITAEKAGEILDINLISPILTCQKFTGIIKKECPDATEVVGKIVNIADVGGRRPWAKYAVYCASKAGLIAVTGSLAKELAPSIYVNAIAPGMVTWPGDFGEKAKKRQLERIPAGRIAEAKDITKAIIFLLKNDYITGQTLNVDGGRCI